MHDFLWDCQITFVKPFLKVLTVKKSNYYSKSLGEGKSLPLLQPPPTPLPLVTPPRHFFFKKPLCRAPPPPSGIIHTEFCEWKNYKHLFFWFSLNYHGTIESSR